MPDPIHEKLSLVEGIPQELYDAIGVFLPSCADLAALSQCCKKLHTAFNFQVYRRAASYPLGIKALLWGAATGVENTVKAALANGIDAGVVWRTDWLGQNMSELSFSQVDRSPPEDATHIRERERRYHWSAIHVAAHRGHVNVLEILLNRDASLVMQYCSGLCCYGEPLTLAEGFPPEDIATEWTLLHVSICSNKTEVTELLLARGVSLAMMPPLPYRRTMSVLHTACTSGNLAMVKRIIDQNHETNIDVVDYIGQTPLVYAYLHYYWDCFEYLRERGANIDFVYKRHEDISSRRTTILLHAIKSLRFKDALRLLDLGADIHVSSQVSTETLIHALCKRPWYVDAMSGECLGEVLLKRLLSLGVSFEYPGETHSALGYAVCSENVAAMRHLIKAGAKVDGADTVLSTPLASACRLLEPKELVVEAVTLLLEAGASPTACRGETTESPLWILYKWPHGPTMRRKLADILLDYGAMPGRAGIDQTRLSTLRPGATALDRMLRDRRTHEFDWLISRCGVESLVDEDILAFWDIAKQGHSSDRIYRKVLDLDRTGAIARNRPDVLNYFLHRRNDSLIVKKLLDDGIVLNAESPSCEATLGIALRSRTEPAIVKQLLDRGVDPQSKFLGQTMMEKLLLSTNGGTVKSGRGGFLGYKIDEKREVVGYLLDAGVVIYDTFVPGDSLSWAKKVISTPLGLAISLKRRYHDLPALMLKRQPFENYPHVDPFPFIKFTCRVANVVVLQALISSSPIILPIIQANANELIHDLLDGIFEYNKTIKDAGRTTDLLQLLFEHGNDIDVDVLPSSAPSEVGQSARRKLFTLLAGDDSDDYWRTGMAWCFRQRMDFDESDKLPTFKTVSLTDRFSPSIRLLSVGEYRSVYGESGFILGDSTDDSPEVWSSVY